MTGAREPVVFEISSCHLSLWHAHIMRGFLYSNFKMLIITLLNLTDI